MVCHGGQDQHGCPKPDTCMPMKGGPIGNDGNECPVSCPVVCGVGEKNCGSGSDENGCPMPDTCRSMYEDCPAIPSTECPGPGTTTPGPVCEDKWKTKKCKKQKDAGKCNKKAVKKNCQKTCEKC